MTRLLNEPGRFAAQMLEGFLDAYAGRVRPAPGGVVRAAAAPAGKVSVVIGGGSGHYPAFAGLVGPGVADAAAVGDVFASPSAQQITGVAHAADHGGGVLFVFGNYAGDVLNFTLAVERLAREGVEARIVTVTDDIASAPPGEEARRRGIAGDLFVAKLAGAAAEAGHDLDGVERVARAANARTRSLGVAFGGCTLPGADHPLFEVPDGAMGLGMGIHGEPGIREQPLPGADELAGLLVARLLAERPSDAGDRAAVLLNGLGATKYEELFVLWGGVARRLAEAGVRVVEPEVGELVTSLDMAGCSLSLCWLDGEDDELSALWSAPADTPAYRKGPVPRAEAATETAPDPALPVTGAPDVPASEESRRLAATVARALRAMLAALRRDEEELGRLDAVAGDGDHGRGMTRGCAAATEAADRVLARGAGAGAVLAAAADAWADRAGGTSGALWGAALAAFGGALGERAGTADLARSAEAAVEAVRRLGGAAPGDKTMVDAAMPFAEALSRAAEDGAEPPDAWARAADAAHAGAEATAPMSPRLGRARPLAERSVGSPDPGAVSFATCVRAIAAIL